MAQSLSNVLLHIIFSTKNREPFIDEEIQNSLYGYISSIFSAHGSFVHTIGGISDHIHIFAELPRTVPISNLLEESKKSSSKWIKTKGPNYNNFAWQKGYGAFSVSVSRFDTVIKYIKNQKKHHQTKSFQDEY